MRVDKLIKEHVKAGYYAVAESVPHIRGLKLRLPQNIFLGVSEQTYIYEIDAATINIYNGSRKIEAYACPEYTSRNFILHDISSRLRLYGIDPYLLQVKKDGKKIKTEDILSLIPSPESEGEQDLEKQLNEFITTGGNYLNPPRKIAEGCRILFERFLKEKK
jgi:hypothetical protein